MSFLDKKIKYFLDEFEYKKTPYERYLEMIDDHEEIDSLMGHPPSEIDPSLAINIQDDDHFTELSRIHSDTELEKSIQELLHSTKRVDLRDISISVRNTNVKLSGTTKSQSDRDYAISLVKLIHGVGDIKAEIVVKLNPGILPTDIGRNP
jgi:hypothetical protein